MLVKRRMTAMERVWVSLSEIFGPLVGAAGPMIFSFLLIQYFSSRGNKNWLIPYLGVLNSNCDTVGQTGMYLTA
jgi:hypothetical protein